MVVVKEAVVAAIKIYLQATKWTQLMCQINYVQFILLNFLGIDFPYKFLVAVHRIFQRISNLFYEHLRSFNFRTSLVY